MRYLLPLFCVLVFLPVTSLSQVPEPGIPVHEVEWDPDRETRNFSSNYEGPIIDTHVHVDPPGHNNISMQEIIDVMDDEGVERIIVMPTPNEAKLEEIPGSGTRRRLELAALAPERIGIMTGSEYLTRWFHEAFEDGYNESELEGLLEKLANDLDSGRFMGVGEIGVHHFTKWGHQAVINFPSDFGPFQEMVALVAEKGVWLDMHAETYDPNEDQSYLNEVLGGVELMFRDHPGLKLVWSHTAMTNAANARELLLRYPSVVMNFKLVMDHSKWRGLEPICDEDGHLYEDWARLFEEMPDRFVVGTDYKFARQGVRTSKYDKTIKRIRKVLGSLSSEAAHMIAYENALRLFWE
ncbi:MAG: hypothetical protein D6E12_11130 [Desulfovibrio sp.]|nr:MAG: hypothetical protein D6E12_11130 [Desulfovibrio sp.]